MKILFIGGGTCNYVADGVLYGLKSMDGILTVDFPRVDVMYTDATEEALLKTGNKGATLYGQLQDTDTVKGKRTYWQRDLHSFDLIVLSDLQFYCELFFDLIRDESLKRKTVIIDGYDSSALFPYTNMRYRLKTKPFHYFHRFTKVKYYKREFKDVSALYNLKAATLLNKLLRPPKKLYPISMSIPEAFIKNSLPENKPALFVKYNVDPQLNTLFNSHAEVGKWQPAYANRDEYLDDLDQAKFGITTKRAGWDCLRHYEYAARGVVLCFKDLAKKHQVCAPFGLNPSNAIVYSTEADLLEQVEKLTEKEYRLLQENTYRWIQNYTCEQVAKRFLHHALNDV